jgi:hypothetical protein
VQRSAARLCAACLRKRQKQHEKGYQPRRKSHAKGLSKTNYKYVLGQYVNVQVFLDLSSPHTQNGLKGLIGRSFSEV